MLNYHSVFALTGVIYDCIGTFEQISPPETWQGDDDKDFEKDSTEETE